MMNWVALPAIALLTGTMPFLREDAKSKIPASTT